MANLVPQKNDFDKAEAYADYGSKCVWIATALSIVVAVYGVSPIENKIVANILALLTLIATVLAAYFERRFTRVYRKAEKTRRDGFIDNVFNTKIADIPSEGYYDTDEIDFGMRKLLSNVHENSLFTEKIVEMMFKKAELKLISAIVVVIIVTVLNVYGTQFIVAVLGIFLSMNFWDEYHKLKELQSEMEAVQTDCKNVWEHFSGRAGKPDLKTSAIIIRAFIRYETALAYASIMLDSKIFKEKNQEITDEWIKLKKRYNM